MIFAPCMCGPNLALASRQPQAHDGLCQLPESQSCAKLIAAEFDGDIALRRHILALLLLCPVPAHAEDAFRWVVQPAFQDAGSAHQGVVPLKQGDLWGLMDLTGQVMTPFEFDAIGTIATVTPMLWQGQWWAIGPDGQPSDVPLPFQELVGNDGTCMVGLENGRPIAVDRGDDQSVVRIDGIDSMSPPSEGYAAFRAGDLAGHVDCVFGSMIGGQPAGLETRSTC